MTSNETMAKVTLYFGGDGKYSTEVTAQMIKVLDVMSDEERDRIYGTLVEDERASFRIGVREIVAAAEKLGISYHKSQFVPTHDWECDACGTKFQYAVFVSDEDRMERGLFDKCPNCGFHPYNTILNRRYKAMTGEDCTWYPRLIKEQQEWRRGSARPYWDREQVKKEIADDRRREIERKIKSWRNEASV